MTGNIIIHNSGNISNQISQTLRHLCSGSLHHPRFIRNCLLCRFHIKSRIDTSPAAKHFQCLIHIQSVTKLRKSPHSLNCTIHTIINITLQSELSVVNNRDTGSLHLNFHQNVGPLGIFALNGMINTVTGIGDSAHRQSCILCKLRISR